MELSLSRELPCRKCSYCSPEQCRGHDVAHDKMTVLMMVESPEGGEHQGPVMTDDSLAVHLLCLHLRLPPPLQN